MRVTSTFAKPDDIIEHYLGQAAKGLRSVAPAIEATMAATTAHGDVTGATRDGYRAYLVGGNVGEQGSAVAALASAVRAVERLNPGRSATADWSMAAQIGIALTSPTDYQIKLETENAGAKAVLGPTIAQFALRCTEAAAKGKA